MGFLVYDLRYKDAIFTSFCYFVIKLEMLQATDIFFLGLWDSETPGEFKKVAFFDSLRVLVSL